MTPTQEIFYYAYDIAHEAHKGQTWGGHPYINHPFEVAMLILQAEQVSDKDIDIETALATALLHDVLEDTELGYTTLVDLLTEYGSLDFALGVADGVWALTKNKRVNRRFRMYDSIKRIKTMPLPVAMVKLADRIVNLSQPKATWDEAKIRDYRDEALKIYNELGYANEFLAHKLLEAIFRWHDLYLGTAN